MSSLLEIAADGERLGVHMIVATERPARVLDGANAPAMGVRIALHLADERESEIVDRDARAQLGFRDGSPAAA